MSHRTPQIRKRKCLWTFTHLMLHTPVLQKRSNPNPCDLKWHLSAQCSSFWLGLCDRSSICLPASLGPRASSSPTAKHVPENSLKLHEALIIWSYCENTRQDTPKLPPYGLQFKLKRVYLLDSMHLFADVTLQSKQLGGGLVGFWWSVSGNISILSSELRFPINIGFGDLNVFQAQDVLITTLSIPSLLLKTFSTLSPKLLSVRLNKTDKL